MHYFICVLKSGSEQSNLFSSSISNAFFVQNCQKLGKWVFVNIVFTLIFTLLTKTFKKTLTLNRYQQQRRWLEITSQLTLFVVTSTQTISCICRIVGITHRFTTLKPLQPQYLFKTYCSSILVFCNSIFLAFPVSSHAYA